MIIWFGHTLRSSLDLMEKPFRKFIVAKFGVFGDPVLSVVVLDAQHENRKAKDLKF